MKRAAVCECGLSDSWQLGLSRSRAFDMTVLSILPRQSHVAADIEVSRHPRSSGMQCQSPASASPMHRLCEKGPVVVEYRSETSPNLNDSSGWLVRSAR